MESEQTRQVNFYELPLAGNLFARACVAGTPDYVDLQTIGNQTKDPTDVEKLGVGCVGREVDIFVDGVVPIYIIAGPTQASVTGGNAPAIATAGTNVAGICVPLYPTAATGPANKPYRYKVRSGTRFLGFISSGTPTIRIAPSSPYQA